MTNQTTSDSGSYSVSLFLGKSCICGAKRKLQNSKESVLGWEELYNN